MVKELYTCPACKREGYMTVISERKGGTHEEGFRLALGKRIKTIKCPYCGYTFEK